MRLDLYYEAKPFSVTQVWGVHRPDVYKQFGFTDHNGIDFIPGWNSRLRAPLNATVTKIGWQPKGAGKYITLLSDEAWEFDDGVTARVLIDYMHLQRTLVDVGTKLEAGDLYSIADNTGFSTGPHTHAQYRRVNDRGMNLDTNAANNSFDPTPYRNGLHAVDAKSVLSNLKTQVAVLQKIIGLISKLLKI